VTGPNARVTRALGLLAVAVLAGLVPGALSAQERIRAYDVQVQVRDDGSIDVAERITVRAEGSQIRRGIYRDVPTVYRDRYGNRVRIDLQVLGVERDGQPEPWFTERLSNGLRINTGDDDYLPALPSEFTFTIRYRANRQLGFFDDHDELYWNAIGTGWVFPIESSSVTIRLPQPVDPAAMGAEAYTGSQGMQGSAYTAVIPAPGLALYRLTGRLDPFEGFTVVLTFPKGIIAEPTAADRRRWFLRDNRGVLVALAGLALLLAFAARSWWRVGRDPKRGAIYARYEPPEGYTPGTLRYLQRAGYDMRCFSADLLGLAVAGHLRIEQGKGRRGMWRVQRLLGHRRTHPTQRALVDSLISSPNAWLDMHHRNATTVQAARAAHSRALESTVNPHYLIRNRRHVWIAFGIIALTGVAAFATSGGAGVPLIIAILLAMIIILTVFARLVRAPTTEGRRLLDAIDGLKMYLSVAERDHIARMDGPGRAPDLNAERYEMLLPFAVALDVEQAWTRKFTAAVGAAGVAAATQRMGWYSGNGRASDLSGFSKAIGSSLTSSISSASSPPGSSSGSGGGGSSGGGGGGGGGGGR
jgi:uncharacterized membrane protein YgcG